MFWLLGVVVHANQHPIVVSVGACATECHRVRPPDAWRGSGIRLAGEAIVLLKGGASSKWAVMEGTRLVPSQFILLVDLPFQWEVVGI